MRKDIDDLKKVTIELHEIIKLQDKKLDFLREQVVHCVQHIKEMEVKAEKKKIIIEGDLSN